MDRDILTQLRMVYRLMGALWLDGLLRINNH
jgi:hypothetical protein